MILHLLACLSDLGPRSAAAHQDACASCHPEAAVEHGASRHARASTSELFVALADHADELPGGNARCFACHRPEPDGDGLTCITCHAAAGSGPTGNRMDPTGPVRARSDSSAAPHATTASAYLISAELCAGCHQVDHPPGFAEHPYDSWLESPAADRNETCADCHGPHRVQGIADGDAAALEQLRSGIEASVHIDDTGSQLTLHNRTGHRFPDGASALRELVLVGGSATLPLHDALSKDGAETADPVRADAKVARGLDPGEVRTLHFADATTVCLRYRPVSAGLGDLLGLETPDWLDVICWSTEE